MRFKMLDKRKFTSFTRRVAMLCTSRLLSASNFIEADSRFSCSNHS